MFQQFERPALGSCWRLRAGQGGNLRLDVCSIPPEKEKGKEKGT
jgi:hypothetical protein